MYFHQQVFDKVEELDEAVNWKTLSNHDVFELNICRNHTGEYQR